MVALRATRAPVLGQVIKFPGCRCNSFYVIEVGVDTPPLLSYHPNTTPLTVYVQVNETQIQPNNSKQLK